MLLWTSLDGQANPGRPSRTYIQQLCADTGYSLEDLPEVMDYSERWRCDMVMMSVLLMLMSMCEFVRILSVKLSFTFSSVCENGQRRLRRQLRPQLKRIQFHCNCLFNWNHFEMRLLNLRINFYLLRTFCPHLGIFFFFLCCFFFHYVSAKFHLWPSSGEDEDKESAINKK